MPDTGESDRVPTRHRVEVCRDTCNSSEQASLVAGTNAAAGFGENGRYRLRLAQQVPHNHFHSLYSQIGLPPPPLAPLTL